MRYPKETKLIKSARFSRFLAGVFGTAVLASSIAGAQVSVEKVAATNKILQQVKARIAKMPQNKQGLLDGCANINHMADVWEKYGMRLTGNTVVVNSRLATIACGS
jgi:hypothetical protein